MSRTVTLPDSVYQRLEAAARDRGLGSVEKLLEQWQWQLTTQTSPQHATLTPPSEDELRRRRELVAEIDSIHEDLSARYGVMPDSVELIRKDRER